MSQNKSLTAVYVFFLYRVTHWAACLRAFDMTAVEFYELFCSFRSGYEKNSKNEKTKKNRPNTNSKKKLNKNCLR